MLNVGPPAQLKSPFRVDKLIAFSGKRVEKGEQLVLITSSDGELAVIPAAVDGTVHFPSTVYEGASVAYGNILFSIAGPAADALQQGSTETPASESNTGRREGPAQARGADPQNPKTGKTRESVAAAKEASPSAFMRAFWTKDRPDVSWGGVVPTIRFLGVFFAIVLACNLILRAAFPDLEIEQMIFPGLAIVIAAGISTMRLAGRWTNRPSPVGLSASAILMVPLGLMISILPDDEMEDLTGLRVEHAIELFQTPKRMARAEVQDATPIVSSSRATEQPGSSTQASAVQTREAVDVDQVAAVPLHAWPDHDPRGPSYIKYMEGTIAIGADVVRRDGPYDNVFLLESGERGMTKAIVSMCDIENDEKWTEIVEVKDGQLATLRHHSDRCAAPCSGCANIGADVILLDIFGSDSQGRPKINREYAGPEGVVKTISHSGFQSPYCNFDWRMCD